MSISQHILEYTLQNRFNGNRSEFAREIGVEPADLRRAMRAMKDGHNSAKMLDLTLELYARDRSAWDVLLHEYMPPQDMLPLCQCQHMTLTKSARDKYMLRAAQEKRVDDLCTHALGLIDRMEAVCCGVNSDRYAACSAFQSQAADTACKVPSDCPCLLLTVFTDALLRYAAGA